MGKISSELVGKTIQGTGGKDVSDRVVAARATAVAQIRTADATVSAAKIQGAAVRAAARWGGLVGFGLWGWQHTLSRQEKNLKAKDKALKAKNREVEAKKSELNEEAKNYRLFESNAKSATKELYEENNGLRLKNALSDIQTEIILRMNNRDDQKAVEVFLNDFLKESPDLLAAMQILYDNDPVAKEFFDLYKTDLNVNKYEKSSNSQYRGEGNVR